jgi:hypothetical protein
VFYPNPGNKVNSWKVMTYRNPNKSCLLLLKIFKVDVLEILWQLALYTMIDRPETSNTHKINQTEEFQYDDAMAI